MAILKDPLFSDEARGQVAKVGVFKRGVFHPVFASYFYHPVNWTPAKVTRAKAWRSLCNSWQALTVQQKLTWSDIAPGVLTGFNYFMQLAGSLPLPPPYEPPAGNNILFNFTLLPYTPPSGGNINFTF